MIDQHISSTDQASRNSSGGVSIAVQQELVREHFQSAATFWEDLYSQNDVYAAIHQQRRSAVLSLVDGLRLPQKSQVLDIGCGAGSISVALASRGFNVKAVDRVPKMVHLTTRLALQGGASANLVASIGDIHHIAFPDSTFSLALAIGVLPWLSSYEAALAEIVRVVKPGGHVVINVDNRWALHRALDPAMNAVLAPLKAVIVSMLRPFASRKLAPASTTISAQGFHSLLRSCGLEPLRGVMLGFGPFSLFHYRLLRRTLGLKLHRTLQQLCDRGFPVAASTGAQYLVLAQKQ